MDIQKEISLRNAISYCIENNDVNTATNKIMEFIRDEKEALSIGSVVGQSEQLKPLPPNECEQCGVLIDHRLNECGNCRL